MYQLFSAAEGSRTLVISLEGLDNEPLYDSRRMVCTIPEKMLHVNSCKRFVFSFAQ